VGRGGRTAELRTSSLLPCVSALYVAVVGAGVSDPRTDTVAYELGRLLGDHGVTVVCGGLGGVMEAACRGAKDTGAITLGILPGADRQAANPFVDYAVATGMGEARNVLIVRTADAVIAVGGEFGTLSEIALALKLGKPVIGLSTWELARAGRPVEAVVPAATPAEAVRLALRLGRERG
jgi:uncharacterized protein (TIGR00725 family)